MCCLLNSCMFFLGTSATLHYSASPNTSLTTLNIQSSTLIAPVFLEVTHISLHLTSPSWFCPPHLIASLASCPEYLILHSCSVLPLHFQQFLLFCHPTFQYWCFYRPPSIIVFYFATKLALNISILFSPMVKASPTFILLL